MRRDLAALTGREHDLVVVGGGIYGVAAAWDAAQRGLATALVEAGDFGSSTSRNSLKTIHGGLRHLRRLDLRRTRESIRERSALLRIAPQVVRPLPFLVPTYGHGLKGWEGLAAGLALSDLLGRDRNAGLVPGRQIPAGRMLSRGEALDLVPGLPERGLTGAAVWHDAQVTSSERLVVGFLRAASEAGAALDNYVEVTGLLRSRERVVGVRAEDRVAGGSLEVRAKLVLNATGPHMDRLLERVGLQARGVPLLRAMNLVLGRPIVTTHAVAAWNEGRYLFLVPWEGRSLLGTGYAAPDSPQGNDAAAFLGQARRAYPWAGLETQDVGLVHRGLVPGRGGAGGLWTRHLLLDHAAHGAPGLLSVQGAKYTVARAAAEQAVDLVVRRLGRSVPPCRTASTPLPLARPLEGSLVERVRQAVRDEMALHLADAVIGRLDMGTGGPPPDADLMTVASVMATELQWSEPRTSEERRLLAEIYDWRRADAPVQGRESGSRNG